MKLYIFSFLLIAFSFSQGHAQDSTRVELKGKVIVDSPDLEGITIYNSSSNKGTITNQNGEFTIKAMLNDKISISALQFKDFTVLVAQDVIDSKQMNVFLVEKVNKLDEVVILAYDLSGVLEEDIANVETFNPDLDAIYFGVGDISAYEFADDQYSKVENIAAMNQNDRLRYQANGMILLESLVDLIFRKKGKKAAGKNNTDNQLASLDDAFNHEYYITNFKIPADKVEAFIAYVQTNNFDVNLLKKTNEMQLIQHLNDQSKVFLNTDVEKE